MNTSPEISSPDTKVERTPERAIQVMQQKHHAILEGVGFNERTARAVAEDPSATSLEISAVQNGKAIVLGVETDTVKAVDVMYQEDSFGKDGQPVTTSKVLHVGSREGMSILTNAELGYTINDFELVESLFDEAGWVRYAKAPDYDLEQGIIVK